MRYEGLRPNFDSKLLRESGPLSVACVISTAGSLGPSFDLET